MTASADHVTSQRPRAALVFASIAAVLASAGAWLGIGGSPFLILPPALCGAPLLARTPAALRAMSIGALVLMLLFTLVASMTAGFLYLPADVALLVAAGWPPRHSARLEDHAS